jgi:hypothetical protein
MTEGSNTQILSLADDAGPLVVKRGGLSMRVEFNAGGTADVYTNIPVTIHAPANDDGGTYVGLSAENGKPLHAALADLPDYKTYEEALAAAEQLKSLHPTAHVPTPKELDKNLFDNRNTGHLKDTFNTSGSYPGSVYRSSASYSYYNARVQWFGDGYQFFNYRSNRLPVRLVW